MQMRRTISISLACFVTSACAIAETSAESTTQSIGVTPGDADMPAQSRSFPCGAEELRSAARVEQQRAHLARIMREGWRM